MNTTDVTATWMKYLKNVDIPANSVGTPHNPMRFIRNEARLKQQALAQMWQQCRRSTGVCKGDAYVPQLESWYPGTVSMDRGTWSDEEFLTSKEEAKKRKQYLKWRQEQINLTPILVSSDVDTLFPMNISVDRLKRIASGRESNPRKAVAQNQTTDYFVEFDFFTKAGKDYPLRTTLSDWEKEEDKEAKAITPEMAQEVLKRWTAFEEEAAELHAHLYSVCLIDHRPWYTRYSNLFGYAMPFSIVLMSLLDLLLLSLLLHKEATTWGKKKREELRVDEEDDAMWSQEGSHQRSSLNSPSSLSDSPRLFTRPLILLLLILSLLSLCLFFVFALPSYIRSLRVLDLPKSSPSSSVIFHFTFQPFVKPCKDAANKIAATGTVLAVFMVAEAVAKWRARREREKKRRGTLRLNPAAEESEDTSGEEGNGEGEEGTATKEGLVMPRSIESVSDVIPLRASSSSSSSSPPSRIRSFCSILLSPVLHRILVLFFSTRLLPLAHVFYAWVKKKRYDLPLYSSFNASSRSFYHSLSSSLLSLFLFDFFLFFARLAFEWARRRLNRVAPSPLLSSPLPPSLSPSPLVGGIPADFVAGRPNKTLLIDPQSLGSNEKGEEEQGEEAEPQTSEESEAQRASGEKEKKKKKRLKKEKKTYSPVADFIYRTWLVAAWWAFGLHPSPILLFLSFDPSSNLFVSHFFLSHKQPGPRLKGTRRSSTNSTCALASSFSRPSLPLWWKG